MPKRLTKAQIAQANKELSEKPPMIIFDQDSGQYVEYKAVRVVNKPARQVEKVLQFAAYRGLLVFKMKLGGGR